MSNRNSLSIFFTSLLFLFLLIIIINDVEFCESFHFFRSFSPTSSPSSSSVFSASSLASTTLPILNDELDLNNSISNISSPINSTAIPFFDWIAANNSYFYLNINGSNVDNNSIILILNKTIESNHQIDDRMDRPLDQS